MVNRNIYNKFHSNRKVSHNIVSDSNFTYINILKFIRPYLCEGGLSVLDIGCGVGSLSFYIASKGNRVTGIDISKNAIDVAKHSQKMLHMESKLRFYHTPIEQFHAGKKFDLIICSEVLEHVVDDLKTLKRVRSLMKTSGTLIISVPSKRAPLYKLGCLAKFDISVGHLRRYDYKSLTELIKKAGLRTITVLGTESIFRNLLFTSSPFGLLIKFLKGPLSHLVSFIDQLFVALLGESQLIVSLKKR